MKQVMNYHKDNGLLNMIRRTDPMIQEDRIRSNLSKTKNNPPKAVIFSDFCCTFAMSLMILLVLICCTKVSEKSDMI